MIPYSLMALGLSLRSIQLESALKPGFLIKGVVKVKQQDPILKLFLSTQNNSAKTWGSSGSDFQNNGSRGQDTA